MNSNLLQSLPSIFRYLEQAFAIALLIFLAMTVVRARQLAIKRDGCQEVSFVFLMTMVTVCTILSRTLLLQVYIPYPIFGGLIQPLLASAFVQSNNHWQLFRSLFASPGAFGWIYDSPILTPIFVAIEMLAGASPHNAALGGSLAALLTLYCCWQISSKNFSRPYAFALCALLAISPFQLTWARLGYRAIWAVPHVLITMQLALAALRRRSIVAAFFAGLIAFASIYNHDTARIALPLGFCLLAISLPKSPFAIRLKLCTTYVVALALAYIAFADGTVRDTFWPKFTGPYAGHMGETGPFDFLAKNLERFSTEAPLTVKQLFVNRDIVSAEGQTGWGLEGGGLIVWPVALLGLLGLLHSARQKPRSFLPWYILFLGSVAVPILSCTQSRRLLLAELAWNAFAAEALIWLHQRYLTRAYSPRHLRWVAVMFVLVGSFHSLFRVWALSRLAPPHDTQQRALADLALVPYGDGCNRDVVACPRCAALGERWYQDIQSGNAVALFDLIPYDGTIAGGMLEYGYLAANRAGRSRYFLDFYGYENNWSFLPKPGVLFPAGISPMQALSLELRRLSPQGLKLYFVRDTAWEAGLIESLRAIGGVVSALSSDALGQISVVSFEHEDLPHLFGELAELETRADRVVPVCDNVLTEEFYTPFAENLWTVGVRSDKHGWMAGKYDAATATWRLIDETGVVSVGQPIEMRQTAEGRVRILASTGELQEINASQVSSISQPAPPRKELIGRNCATVIGSDTVVIDSWTGSLESSLLLPFDRTKRYVAVGSDGNDILALIGNDQMLQLWSKSGKRMIRDFPVTILPVRDWDPNECPLVLVGKDWVAITLHALGSRLDFYSFDGKLKRMTNTGRIVGTGERVYIPLAVSGNRVVAADNAVRRGVHVYRFSPDTPCNDYFLPADGSHFRQIIANFEREMNEWKSEGLAFGTQKRHSVLHAIPGQSELRGYGGEFLANSFVGTDATVGTLTSPPFVITKNHLKLMVGGGNHPDTCYVALVVNGEVVRRESGNDSETLTQRWWDVSPWLHQDAEIRIVDKDQGGWGHILVDDIELIDLPPEVHIPAGPSGPSS